MKAQLIKKENNQAVLEIVVENSAFLDAEKKAYNKLRGKFSVPGFRKGKVPMAMIERNYGEGVFFEEAVNIILPEAYEFALTELNIEPVDRPEIDIKEIGKKSDLIIEAEVTVRPEVKLGKYKDVEVEKIEYTVSDEDIAAELEKSREMNARIVNVEDRAVADKDTVLIDYKGFVGEEQFDGGTADDHSLEIGSGAFIPGFEEQLIGAKIGEEVEVKVTFPEEYHSEDLKGKDAIFKVNVKEIKAKELPELDDEFAKDTSEFDTLDELKADIKNRLEESAKTRSENEQREVILKEVVEAAEIEIPEVMIDAESDNMLRDFDYQLRYQGLDLDNYMKFAQTSREQLKEQMKEDAIKRVRTSLVVEEIIKAEDLKATEDDIEVELKRISEIQKQSVEDVKKVYARDNFEYIRSTIESKKAVDMIVESAKLK